MLWMGSKTSFNRWWVFWTGKNSKWIHAAASSDGSSWLFANSLHTATARHRTAITCRMCGEWNSIAKSYFYISRETVFPRLRLEPWIFCLLCKLHPDSSTRTGKNLSQIKKKLHVVHLQRQRLSMMAVESVGRGLKNRMTKDTWVWMKQWLACLCG